MSKKHTIKAILIALVLFFTTGPLSAFAQEQTKANIKNAFDTSSSSALGIASGASYNRGIVLESIAGQVITAIFSLLGVIFILFTIYGGFLYMNARGNEEQTKKAKSIITQNIIGIFIILGAYALVYFIIKFFI